MKHNKTFNIKRKLKRKRRGKKDLSEDIKSVCKVEVEFHTNQDCS